MPIYRGGKGLRRKYTTLGKMTNAYFALLGVKSKVKTLTSWDPEIHAQNAKLKGFILINILCHTANSQKMNPIGIHNWTEKFDVGRNYVHFSAPPSASHIRGI